MNIILYPVSCECHAILDEDCLVHERVRDCGSVELKLLVAISYPNWNFPWTSWPSCLLIPSLPKMLTAQLNSLTYISAAYFPKAEYTMNNMWGREGGFRYCRKFAESISAETDVCIWQVYQFILDPFWIHRAIIRDTERELRLSRPLGIITPDDDTTAKCYGCSCLFVISCPKSFTHKEDLGLGKAE